MLVQVNLEGITCPAPQGLNSFEGDPLKEIYEDPTYAEAVSMDWTNTGCCGGTLEVFKEFQAGKWSQARP